MKGWVFYAALPAVCWATFAHQPVALADMVIADAIITVCPTTQLPKTGITTCDQEGGGGQIPCAGTGQDGEYADPEGSYDYGSPRGAPTWVGYNATRFINNGDGTVTDMATGLMWVSNPGSASRGGTYNWTNAINASENLTYATYSDWRLPNIRELQSIVDFETYQPAIDTTFFTCQQMDYWSSTTNAPENATTAWARDFEFDGETMDWPKTTTYRIRPVRQSQPGALAQTASDNVIMAPCPPTGLPKTGQTKCYDAAGGEISCAASGQDAEYADPAGSYDYGSPRGTGTWANYNATRFINNTDGTVTDRATGLMWVANSTAAGRGGSYLWYNAINASENLTYATYSDWRLPNVNELESIVNYHRNGPAIDTTFFVSRSAEYWSSTIFSYSWPGSIYVEFTWGTMQDFSREDDYAYIRPVRQSQ